MMAHDTYNLMISLALDGQLAEEDEKELRQHIQGCGLCANTWDQMTMLDAMFNSQAEVNPPPDLLAGVMAYVEGYKMRRRWYPWLVASVSIISLLAALNIAAPLLVLSLGLYKPMLEWPTVSASLNAIAQAFYWLQAGADFSANTLRDWFVFLTTDPLMLASALSALVLASIWIGLREGFKSTALSLSEGVTSQQSV